MDTDTTRLDWLRQAIEKDIEKGQSHGIAISVARGGEIVYEGAFGYADRSTGRPLTVDDPIFTMSVAKQFSLFPILRQVEMGHLSLLTRVAEIIPEFASRGKGQVTLAHLLSHTSGLTAPPPPPATDLGAWGHLNRYVAAVCDCPLEAVPGTQVKYSPRAGHAVMAEMARRADGGSLRFSELVQRDLFTPLRMTSSSLGPREDLVERMCPVVATYEKGLMIPTANYSRTVETDLMPGAENPAGGGITTLRDMQRLVEALRRGGELDGQRVISEAMLELTTSNQTGSMSNSIFNLILADYQWDPWPARLGYGWILGSDQLTPGPMGHLSSPRTFGGMGAGSNGFWVDPVHDVTFVFLSTGLMEESENQQRMRRYADLALSVLP